MADAKGLRKAASIVPLLVIAAGMAFVLYLQAPITSEVFFNGDGGVKFLLARQFASGDLRTDMHLPSPDWAVDLWKDGLFPFHPPFVYEREGLHYAQYPIYFPLLTAPFYRLLGVRGLYLIPAASLFVFWLGFRSLCARLGLGLGSAAAAHLSLVFASPLTLYGAMFWEHTLAIALAFPGLALVIAPPEGAGRRTTACLAALLGLSSWFRPEMTWFVVLLSALALVSPHREERSWPRGLFAASALAAALASLGANWVLAGHPLGYYWYTAYGPGQKLALYPEALAAQTGQLLYYCPLVLVPAACAILTARDWRRALAWPVGGLVALGALFVPLVSLFWPMGGGRQWGPRFLLIVVPITALLCGLFVQRMQVLLPRLPRFLGILAFVGAAGLGFARNTLQGSERVIQDSVARVQPALDLVLRSDLEVVAVSRQWISQDLAAAMDRKVFFLAPTFADLGRLAAALTRRGASGFVYLCLADEPPPPPLRFGSDGAQGRVGFVPAGLFGQYAVYEARLGAGGGPAR